MSYDIRLEIDTGGESPASVTEWKSPTYNLGPMFSLALGEAIRSLDGKTGEDCKPILRRGIAFMQDKPNECKKLEPENGWGSYEGAFETLVWLLEQCCNHPKAMVKI